jgi:endonuclease/exonuclease/phosphatase family metal-dependent hydrolase
MKYRLETYLPVLCLNIYLLATTTCPAQTPVVVQTNTTIRVMAANLTSGNNQRWESPGLNILKGIKPDVACVQEFNYRNLSGTQTNTPTALREMIDSTFGTNFYYYREPITQNGPIPNGIISRYPIIASGSWADAQQTQPNRGFAWVQLDIPGTNNLYVISVHLLTRDAPTRNSEAMALKALIEANFPANSWIIIAGDTNIGSSTEAALATFKTFLSDTPIPTDAESDGDADTNAGRGSRYDFVFPSFNLSSNQVAAVVGGRTFTKGLVFDSRVFTPLANVPPIQSGDSGASMMQHMGVLKDFNISYSITNYVTNIVVTPPLLVLQSSNVLRWQGTSNVTYKVQALTNLNFTNWITIGTASSTTTNFSFTNSSGSSQGFFRVTHP